MQVFDIALFGFAYVVGAVLSFATVMVMAMPRGIEEPLDVFLVMLTTFGSWASLVALAFFLLTENLWIGWKDTIFVKVGWSDPKPTKTRAKFSPAPFQAVNFDLPPLKAKAIPPPPPPPTPAKMTDDAAKRVADYVANMQKTAVAVNRK